MSNNIDELRNFLIENEHEVSDWFAETFASTPPFFYSSVDLRHSGFKIAPVDTNLFPGGFNNLSDVGRKKAVGLAKDFFAKYHPSVSKVLVIAEDHTRNLFYLENVFVIKKILEDSGIEVKIGSFNSINFDESLKLETINKNELEFSPLEKEGDKVKTKDGFVPDLLLVNNDLTTGAPDIIKDIDQPVIPPVGFGWYQRRKTSHFETYNDLVKKLATRFNFDPWLMTTIFHRCGKINFKEKKGLDCVALGVEKVLYKITQKYEEYGIGEKPYVFIKSDKGTYGMGVMTVESSDDLYEMNKKIRNKMNTIKGGEENTEVIIQEGVPTIDVVEGNPAELMAYLVGGRTAGCIYRVNSSRDKFGNLNSSGMEFVNVSADQLTGQQVEMCKLSSTIARLASYAAAWECYTDSYTI